MSDFVSGILSECRLCPRECGVNRLNGKGFCGEGRAVRIARAEPHYWEEPCLSGKNGSGAVFFCGCNLKCCYCQNYEISHEGKGFELDDTELAQTFMRLQKMGVHNIDLVNPTHFVPQILNALDILDDRLRIPLVYNCGGYEKPQTIELLDGRVSIFLPDLKYYDGELSLKYSAAQDYFDHAIESIRAMADMVGKPKTEDGTLKSGVVVRHMILPNHRHDSIRLIEKLSENFSPDEIMVSLMSQYTPMYKASEYKEINRRVCEFEYNSVKSALEKAGFDGYFQLRESANEAFVPKFYSEKYF